LRGEALCALLWCNFGKPQLFFIFFLFQGKNEDHHLSLPFFSFLLDTPLHRACWNGNVELVTLLIEQGLHLAASYFLFLFFNFILSFQAHKS